MKKIIYTIVILSAISFTFSLQAQSSLIINFNDGSSSNNLLSSLRKVTFPAGNMIVSKNDATSNTYALTSIRKMNFGLYSGVNDLAANNSEISVYPMPAHNFISIKNAPEGEIKLTVFNMNGSVIKNYTLSNGSQPLDISFLNNGMYFLRINDKILKFTKQ